MKKIKLSSNKYNLITHFLVNDVDFELVKNFKWCVSYNGFNYYILRKATDQEVSSGWPKLIYLHRYIFNLKKGNKKVVDHVHRSRWWDHTRKNIRVCTPADNSKNINWNRGVSGVTGVYYRKETKLWIARITLKGKPKYIGASTNKETAIKMRKEAEEKFYGDFAFKQEGD